MEFENSPSGDGGSYEKPKAGKYIGVLVGFAYVGTHTGGQYGPKPKVLLRWELHKRKGPSLDSQGYPHTITSRYSATIRGDNSLLRKALAAHGINVAEGEKTDSRDWLGKAAWIDVEWSDDDKYANVVGVSPLDPEDDEVPERKLATEHWEPADGTPPPGWARWAVGRSTDLAHLVKDGNGKASGGPVPAGVGAGGDDDDIPF
jgi:hypothetical protein